MKKIKKEAAEPIFKVLELIEKVISKRKLDSKFHRDEVEKHFSYIMQGQDQLNAYERRDAGVTDEEWKQSLNSCFDFLKLEEKKHEKLFD